MPREVAVIERFLAVFWNERLYGKVPIRGWPVCLGYVRIDEFDSDKSALAALYSKIGGLIPHYYNLCGMCCDPKEVDRIQSPERVLKARFSKLKKKCELFPLFPDYIREAELARNPNKYTLSECQAAQAARKELVALARIDEDFFRVRMVGSDEWRGHNWAAIALRSYREIVRRGGRSDWRELYSARAKEMGSVAL